MSPRTAANTATASEPADASAAEPTSTGPRRGRRADRSGATTSARPSAGITLDEQPVVPTAASETATEDQDGAGTTVPTVAKPGGRRRPRQSAPPQQLPTPPKKKPFEREPNERRLPFAPRTNETLKARLDGATDWLRKVETTDADLPELLQGWDCRSQHDLVNMGIHMVLTLLEDHANRGQPFPVQVRRS